MILHALADITCDGSTHTLSATPLNAKWVQAVTPSGNSAFIRYGGTEVTGSIGLPIPVGWAGMLLPPIAELTEFYDLSQIKYNGTSGDKLYILYGG